MGTGRRVFCFFAVTLVKRVLFSITVEQYFVSDAGSQAKFVLSTATSGVHVHSFAKCPS
jgi:hypothetical protein